MSEEKNSNRKAGGNADIPVDISEFMPPMSFTGGRADMTKPMQADNQTDNQEETPDMSEQAEEKPAKRKRGQPADYESLFLVRNELRDRQGLCIGRENYGILQTLVRAIRNERLSVSGLVDNIISQHIELYGVRLTAFMMKIATNLLKRDSKNSKWFNINILIKAHGNHSN